MPHATAPRALGPAPPGCGGRGLLTARRSGVASAQSFPARRRPPTARAGALPALREDGHPDDSRSPQGCRQRLVLVLTPVPIGVQRDGKAARTRWRGMRTAERTETGGQVSRGVPHHLLTPHRSQHVTGALRTVAESSGQLSPAEHLDFGLLGCGSLPPNTFSLGSQDPQPVLPPPPPPPAPFSPAAAPMLPCCVPLGPARYTPVLGGVSRLPASGLECCLPAENSQTHVCLCAGRWPTVGAPLPRAGPRWPQEALRARPRAPHCPRTCSGPTSPLGGGTRCGSPTSGSSKAELSLQLCTREAHLAGLHCAALGTE